MRDYQIKCIIMISASMGDPNELAQMVAEINMDQVALDERLSNQGNRGSGCLGFV
jgi:hypothetical protein